MSGKEKLQGLVQHSAYPEIWIESTDEKAILMADPSSSMLGSDFNELAAQIRVKYPVPIRYSAIALDLMMLAPLTFNVRKQGSYWNPVRHYVQMPYPYWMDESNVDFDILLEVLNAAGPVLVASGGKTLADFKEEYDTPGLKIEHFDYIKELPGSFGSAAKERDTCYGYSYGRRRKRTGNQLFLMRYNKIQAAKIASYKPRTPPSETIDLSDLSSFMWEVHRALDELRSYKIYGGRGDSERHFRELVQCIELYERQFGKGTWRALPAYSAFFAKVIKTKEASLRKWWHRNERFTWFMHQELSSKVCRFLRKKAKLEADNSNETKAEKDKNAKDFAEYLCKIGKREPNLTTFASPPKDWLPKLLRPKPKKPRKKRRRKRWQKELANAAKLHANRDGATVQLQGACAD